MKYIWFLPIGFIIVHLTSNSHNPKSEDFKKIETITDIALQSVALVIYLMLLSNETYLEIFSFIHVGVTFTYIIIFQIIYNHIYKKELINRILDLGDVSNLTNGQVRKLLYKKYNKFYSIEDVRKILKKLYNVIREDDKKKDDIDDISELIMSAYTEDKESDKNE